MRNKATIYKYLLGYLCIGMCIFASCSKDTSGGKEEDSVINEETLFKRLDSSKTGLDFVNLVEDTKEFNVLTYRNYYNGGGVAIGDINNDGLPDIYFTANMTQNKLYLNKGNWQFEDITEQAGVGGTRAWSTGVSMADVNGDGWLDIYVCNSGDIEGDNKENELFINTGKNLLFEEKAKAYNLNDEGFTTHASFFDYDQDGDLDCYILNNSFRDPEKMPMMVDSRQDRDNMGGDKLFRNDGKKFTDVTQKAGIYNSQIGFGLGVSVSDLNGDRLPDIYVANDFWERDYLYINQGNGTFSEELTERISNCSVSSMGSDIADLNNDGTYEIFTTDMLAADNYRLKAMTMFDSYNLEDIKFRSSFHYQILQNSLQVNDGKGNFQETANLSGVSATDWSWGALIFDFDNDGWKDIFVSNGVYRDIMYLDFTSFLNDQTQVKKIVQERGGFDWRDFVKHMPSNPLSNYAFINQQNLTFDNQAQSLGLEEKVFSNGSAYGDLDGDGDLDLVLNNVNTPSFVYENTASEKNNYLKIAFEGKGKNPLGIGTEVTIKIGDRTQVQQHFLSRGFESSVEPGLVFGLGKSTQIDLLTVSWPDGSAQEIKNIQANQQIILKQNEAKFKVKKGENKEGLFVEVSESFFEGDTRHVENLYNDFNHERLLPRMLSTEGPKILHGDVNGDQMEDMILLGAADDPEKLFFFSNGKYVFQEQSIFEEDKAIESTCGALFDSDGDGDLDLLVGAGGNEYGKGIRNFVLRYYKNDGKGNFSKAVELTPPAAGNFSCIVPGDLDKDGDMDLFIGGRAVPGNYGLPARSFLFRNDGNDTWTDIILQQAGNFGMITDAAWGDFNKDGNNDLVLVGEWMPIIILEGNGENIVNRVIVPDSFGWWTNVEVHDLDKDGNLDFVLGNWGTNSKLKASKEKPLSMYVKDFDDNKKTEFVINWYAPDEDRSYPFASKMDISEQLPHLKKSILKYEDYANKTYETLLSEEEREGAISYVANYLESAILWNNEGKLRLEALPIEAQVAPSFAVSIGDMDQDGHVDIWLGGNFYGLKPQFGRHDSHRGVLLKGDGNRNFSVVDAGESGIVVKGEVRDAWTHVIDNVVHLFVARNNETVAVFKKR